MQVLDKPANRQRGCAHAAGEFDHSISRRDRVGIKGILDRSVKAKHPAAREAQLSRIAEVQDQVAAAFSHRCKNDLTAHVLAALTLSALSLTYRVWFATRKEGPRIRRPAGLLGASKSHPRRVTGPALRNAAAIHAHRLSACASCGLLVDHLGS